MVVEISIEEVEQAISRLLEEKVQIVMDRDYVTNYDRLKVIVKKKGKPDEEVYKLTSTKGNIWKKFIVWSVADGFVKMSGQTKNLLNEG